MSRLDHRRRPPIASPRDLACLALVLAVSLLGAGCSDRQAAPRTTPSSTTPSSTTTAQPSGHSRAERALRPCLSLDARDLAALGVTGQGTEEPGENGPTCRWEVGGQNVSLDLDVPASYARTMTKGGRLSQVPVGRRTAVQAEFHRICFTFVTMDEPDHLIGATTIPDPGAPQEGACPAGASIVAAALTHLD